MHDADEKLRQEVVLFRYGLIADLLALRPGSRDIGAKLKQKAAKRYVILGTRRTRVAVETMRGWLKLYRRSGFDALYANWRVRSCRLAER